MVYIRMKGVCEHFRPEIAIALEEAVKENVPRAYFDSNSLLFSFTKSLQGVCEEWEEMPDDIVRVE